MRSVTARIGIIAGCAIAMTAVQVLAQDWPQWLGPNRDGKVAGFTPPATWPKTLAPKWKVSVGTGDATPALVGDKLYVFARQGGDEVISCLEAESGKKVWEQKYPAQPASGPASGHAGPRSSPLVIEGKVVTLGVSGMVSCLDAASGKIVWQNKDFFGKVPRFFTSMSPLAVDGMAIFQLGGNDGGLRRLRPGHRRAEVEVGRRRRGLRLARADDRRRHEGHRRPNEQADGGPRRGRRETPVVGALCARGMGYNAVTPIVDGQTLIYSGQGRGIKAVKFEKKGDGLAATQVWSNSQSARSSAPPVLKGGLIFGLSDKGVFFCLDAKTGKTAWTDGGGPRQLRHDPRRRPGHHRADEQVATGGLPGDGKGLHRSSLDQSGRQGDLCRPGGCGQADVRQGRGQSGSVGPGISRGCEIASLLKKVREFQGWNSRGGRCARQRKCAVRY